MSRAPLKLLALVVVAFITPALAQQDVFTNRPAFSQGDLPAQSYASCETLRAMAEGVGEPEFRIDLSLGGRLTLVRSDGALWYLVMCSDLRVMCVTYEQNEMKAGDQVYFRGAYRRLDPNHAVLDPCLASREPQ
jgi:hypothetical protein